MICLGIEGTAHTLGLGLVDSERILGNVSSMYVPEVGGIHPREAAEHHSTRFPELLRELLDISGIDKKDIGLIAFSIGPGLGPCLRAVATVSRALSLMLDVPLVGVNHCVAHMEVGRWKTAAADPVLLYTSGGNTQVITFHDNRYRVIGETEDIGIGNMLDKFARQSGIAFPGGPLIEKIARCGNYHELPYSVKGMNVAFSGIMTAARSLVQKGISMQDVCYSIQETTFAMLTEITERAMAHTGKREVLMGGGVARNMRLQEMVSIMAEERGAECFVPSGELCVDNGVMIAHTGMKMFEAGITTAVEDSHINPTYRTDEVTVSWR